MNTKSQALRTYLFSTAGLVAMAILLVAVNLILSVVNLRVDCTEENLHTLSKGTREILAKLDTPVSIRFYFSRNVPTLPMTVKNYARRVEDLLKEYKRYGHGKIEIEKLDPEPDSDAEDAARQDGIQNVGYYFGLAVTCVDETEPIPVLSPSREDMLEYDITRAIHRVLHPEKPLVGVLSSLPVMGSGNQNPMMNRGQQQKQPWLFTRVLKQDYEVEEVAKDTESIADNIDILLLIHPKDLSDKTLFAIDQYVLRGGRVLCFMDAMSIAEQMSQPPQMMGMRPPTGASDLGPLMGTWGVELVKEGGEPGVIADTKYMVQFPGPPGQPDQTLPTLLQLTGDAVNKDEISVGQLDNIWYANGGAFDFQGETGLKRTTLLASSEKAGFVQKFQAMSLDPQTGQRILDSLKIDEKAYPLGVCLQGSFKTAFPDGKPGEEKKADEKKEDGDKDKAETDSSLKKSAKDSVVLLFADSDMIFDQIAFAPANVGFGRSSSVYEPRNDNIKLLMNSLEWLSGDQNLISLRSRGIKKRPLQRLADMLADAREKHQAVLEDVEKEVRETQERLSELGKKKAPGQNQRWHLSKEQQEEIQNLQKKLDAHQKRQKELRKEYRAGVETMEKWLMFLNIGLMPLLVAIAGITLALIKRRRMVRK
jgi:ABC-type uncharacterized transport system involved in gliding motility auxiliary subunit